jgi:hypothetical protein
VAREAEEAQEQLDLVELQQSALNASAAATNASNAHVIADNLHNSTAAMSERSTRVGGLVGVGELYDQSEATVKELVSSGVLTRSEGISELNDIADVELEKTR